MNKDNTITFSNFLKQQGEFFTTVEEQEDYQYHHQGIFDHVNGILKLIFNDITDLSDEEHSLYTKLLLRSLSRASGDNTEDEQPKVFKNDSSTVKEGSKFNTFLMNYLAESLR